MLIKNISPSKTHGKKCLFSHKGQICSTQLRSRFNLGAFSFPQSICTSLPQQELKCTWQTNSTHAETTAFSFLSTSQGSLKHNTHTVLLYVSLDPLSTLRCHRQLTAYSVVVVSPCQNPLDGIVVSYLAFIHNRYPNVYK